jgi:hypothetical protein
LDDGLLPAHRFGLQQQDFTKTCAVQVFNTIAPRSLHMSENRWQNHAAHGVHVALHTETGKKALHTAATTLAAATPAVVVVAAAVALPVAAICAVGYGLYRLLW